MDYYHLNNQIDTLKRARRVFLENGFELSSTTLEETDDLIEKLTEERDSL